MCLTTYVWDFSESLMHRAAEETVGSLRDFPQASRRRQDWIQLAPRALEDAMVPQFLGGSRHQMESGSSLAVEGLSRRIVEVESLMPWHKRSSATSVEMVCDLQMEEVSLLCDDFEQLQDRVLSMATEVVGVYE